MGVTKTDLFSKEQNELARYAKVLAHPARIAILQFLLKSDRCINGDLVNELGLAQATISQHLRELKNAGIIQGSIEGVSVSYCINTTNWYKIQQLLNVLFDGLKTPEPKNCC
ncbi:metalloregulator ArsR/SmtB family transcription factor [uncultured Christiangramia sp.]|uniref:ArsR/SmtB family transcription factor n=1 Tax=uncultured Christiangramia sp. TaxID=503836 RepID=UPI0025DBF379|nr:metalloregulator ArsR/SmtB family transcription factor [uncultured Christiangramia sp.]|tara:strand:- start:2488 stop:2823 length:336 start_codon:yes stop_codon:yes gene_type:complete